MGYYNVLPNYILSTSTISKSLLESGRFNQGISMQSGSSTCYSAFISVSQPQSLSLLLLLLLLLLLQPQWQACTWGDCVCASPVLSVQRQRTRACACTSRRPMECMTCFNQPLGHRIRVSALHPGHPLIKLSHFDFWELHQCLSSSPSTTWESVPRPSSSIHNALFASGTPPAFRTRGRHLSAVTSEHPDTPRKQQLSRNLQMQEDGEQHRESQEGGRTDACQSNANHSLTGCRQRA